MIYKKVCIILTIVAFGALILTNAVFGTSISTGDEIYDSVFNVLVFIQKYSWPIVTIIFIYALYQFYLLGSKFVEKKFMGQRLIVSLAIFMAVIQSLPLIYALLVST